MSPRFLLGRENVPCVAEVVNRSLKADCTDFTAQSVLIILQTNFLSSRHNKKKNMLFSLVKFNWYHVIRSN